jgi:hypothetical protein
MTRAPVRKRRVVLRTVVGGEMGVAMVPASSVLKRQGKKR